MQTPPRLVAHMQRQRTGCPKPAVPGRASGRGPFHWPRPQAAGDHTGIAAPVDPAISGFTTADRCSRKGVTAVNDEGRPVAYTALARGTPVISRSGRAFGTLDRVLDDRADIFHGIVVATGAGPRFVPRDSIERMTTTQIRCALTDEQAAELPPATSDRRTRTKPWFARRVQ